jgi:hypothetical protein
MKFKHMPKQRNVRNDLLPGHTDTWQLHEGFKKLSVKPTIFFSREDFDDFTNNGCAYFSKYDCALSRIGKNSSPEKLILLIGCVPYEQNIS